MSDTTQAVPVTILLGIGLFFISLSVTAIYILRKRFLSRTVRVGFISDGGHIERKRYKRSEINKTINYGKGKYVFDNSSVVTTQFGSEIYYFLGNPNPVKFNKGGVVSNIDSENLKAIIETELIAKLFKKEVFSMDNILILIVLVSNVIGLILVFSMYNGGVTLSDNPENVEILKSIIKQALSSGV